MEMISIAAIIEDVLTVEAGPEAGTINDWFVRSTTILGDV